MKEQSTFATPVFKSYFSSHIKSMIKKGIIKPGVNILDYRPIKLKDSELLRRFGCNVIVCDKYKSHEEEKTRYEVVVANYTFNAIEKTEDFVEAIKEHRW